ncbi:hypothetical protein CECT5772_01553 [Streptococcus equi subsp. ruminatorum CECT 5772]|uniref:Uncharacterized protein n=1 Tax=Streptococcus equi subsp. ruminatorum CECT 5772 TaxID=1051981 RepID=A0A922T4K6_9STRE|nr:hypothetical protein CECT5772_01553 [Streptococcus equi subsp. ruminatorum CECT 5772]
MELDPIGYLRKKLTTAMFFGAMTVLIRAASSCWYIRGDMIVTIRHHFVVKFLHRFLMLVMAELLTLKRREFS